MSGKVPEWARQDMRKSAGYGCTPGVKQMGNPFHGAKQVRHYADGSEGGVKADDEATLKQEGLDISNKEAEGRSTWENMKAGFGRLFEGNIDDPNSKAYQKYGAGRGKDVRAGAQEDAKFAEVNRLANERADKDKARESEYDAAEKQLDSLNAMKASAPKAAAPAAKPKEKPAVMDRPLPDENQSAAEMARLNRAPKPEMKGKRNLGRAAAVKRAQ